MHHLLIIASLLSSEEVPSARSSRKSSSVLTAHSQRPHARLRRRKVEGEREEQAIMEERKGEAFAGTEQFTVIGRQLQRGRLRLPPSTPADYQKAFGTSPQEEYLTSPRSQYQENSF
jgi:hypothetical protein